MACSSARFARRPQLRAGRSVSDPGIICPRRAAPLAGFSGAILVPGTCRGPCHGRLLTTGVAGQGLTGQTWVDTQFMKSGVVWGIVSNHPDASLESQATLTIKKGRQCRS